MRASWPPPMTPIRVKVTSAILTLTSAPPAQGSPIGPSPPASDDEQRDLQLAIRGRPVVTDQRQRRGGYDLGIDDGELIGADDEEVPDPAVDVRCHGSEVSAPDRLGLRQDEPAVADRLAPGGADLVFGAGFDVEVKGPRLSPDMPEPGPERGGIGEVETSIVIDVDHSVIGGDDHRGIIGQIGSQTGQREVDTFELLGPGRRVRSVHMTGPVQISPVEIDE